MGKRIFFLPPRSGKRLIAKGILGLDRFQQALEHSTVVIVAGSTNRYLAEEILGERFPGDSFIRGCLGSKESSGPFPGDVVLRSGAWRRGETIFDAVDTLKAGDLVLKGANALNYEKKQAGLLVGHPEGGTILTALQAVMGHRASLLIPVGLEKSIFGDVFALSRKTTASDAEGPRFLPLPGDIVTEIEALKILTGMEASFIASGGIGGGEGGAALLVEGPEENGEKARELIRSCGGTQIP